MSLLDDITAAIDAIQNQPPPPPHGTSEAPHMTVGYGTRCIICGEKVR